jgi:hypothetical protein
LTTNIYALNSSIYALNIRTTLLLKISRLVVSTTLTLIFSAILNYYSLLKRGGNGAGQVLSGRGVAKVLPTCC